MTQVFHIYRYDPDQDARPRMQRLEIEVDPADRMLLDVLIKLKALDPSLSFRRSCREGICGSDAMNINGKNGLACITNMQALPHTIVLKPLPGLPVNRDLIVDMTGFLQESGVERSARADEKRAALDHSGSSSVVVPLTRLAWVRGAGERVR